MKNFAEIHLEQTRVGFFPIRKVRNVVENRRMFPKRTGFNRVDEGNRGEVEVTLTMLGQNSSVVDRLGRDSQIVTDELR